MAKVIKYFRCIEENEKNLILVEMGWNEVNEGIAKREAYKGEYTIEDDGRPEPATEVSTDDVLDAMLGVM